MRKSKRWLPSKASFFVPYATTSVPLWQGSLFPTTWKSATCKIFLSLLGWVDDPGFIIRIHAQEFNSFPQFRPESARPPDFLMFSEDPLQV
jgi:hypothetical protein